MELYLFLLNKNVRVSVFREKFKGVLFVCVLTLLP